MDEAFISRIKQDFTFLQKNKSLIQAILLFGSIITENFIQGRSDIDICLVAPTANDKKDQMRILKKTWQKLGGKYDIWIFEELPFYMKAEVIQNHRVLYCKDKGELYEYFYQFRRRITRYEHRLRIAYSD